MEVALNWEITAKTSFKNVNGYSPNQLVFGRNPSFPNVDDNDLQAFSKLVAKNLNAMHSARKNFIESESSSKLKKTMKHY